MENDSVTQSHTMGCGVACVAYILDVSYYEALSLFDEPENAKSIGYYCEDIVSAFRKVNRLYDYAEHILENSNLLDKENIIVFCPPHNQYLSGHYFAKTDNKWMNPWINCPIIHPTLSGFEQFLPIQPSWIIYSPN